MSERRYPPSEAQVEIGVDNNGEWFSLCHLCGDLLVFAQPEHNTDGETIGVFAVESLVCRNCHSDGIPGVADRSS